MVFIFTALFPEARPLIKKLGLKKRTDKIRFQQFVPEMYLNSDTLHVGDVLDDTIRPEIVLTVTGVGPIAAATAVSSTLTEYNATSYDQMLSFGTAAFLHRVGVDYKQSSESKSYERSVKAKMLVSDSNAAIQHSERYGMFLLNKILDQNVDKTFYPDMLIENEMPEASVVTGSTVLSERAAAFMDIAAEDYDLYDMEAAAIYQAGAFYLGPHQMSFIRVVTDNGIKENEYDVGAMSKIIGESVTMHVDEIASYVEKLISMSHKDKSRNDFLTDEDILIVDRIIRDAHFSRVMQDQLRQYVKYAVLSDVDWKSPVNRLYQDGVLPTVDKRNGKKVLDAIRSSITE